MGRVRIIWIAAVVAALAAAPAAGAAYNPRAFHPFDFPDPYACPPEVVGTDVGEQLGGVAVLGMGGDDAIQGQAAAGNCLRGGAGNDRITGSDGRDSLDGDDGNDRVVGGAGRDGIDGGFGADVLIGDDGADAIDGEMGDDRIAGGSGNDRIRGGAGHNRIDAGPGADKVSSVNGVPETVRCGSGHDVIWADRADRLVGCESVHRVRNPLPAVTPRVGSRTTTFHISFRAPFNTDDPCDCVGYWVEQAGHPAGGGCARNDITGWDYGDYSRRLVEPIHSSLPGGLCRGVYSGEISFRFDGVDNCQTRREGRGGRLDECEARIGLGTFSFRVR